MHPIDVVNMPQQLITDCWRNRDILWETLLGVCRAPLSCLANINHIEKAKLFLACDGSIHRDLSRNRGAVANRPIFPQHMNCCMLQQFLSSRRGYLVHPFYPPHNYGLTWDPTPLGVFL